VPANLGSQRQEEARITVTKGVAERVDTVLGVVADCDIGICTSESAVAMDHASMTC
jgi:hypothetical protein